jgi:hypothetical protein
MHIDFIVFNFAEGLFWFVCAFVSLFGTYFVRKPAKLYWRILAINCALFGVSDFAEVLYNESFLLASGLWLLIWKSLCVLVFIVLLGYYIRVRLKL